MLLMASQGLLLAGTRWDSVRLAVADLGRSLAYYTEKLGLTVHAQSSSHARLGAPSASFLILDEEPGAWPARHVSGLFHFAVLVPSRESLAGSLRRLVETRTPLQGAADHLVSEALYLGDPDGNGIEIYRDRPREEWRWENGEIAMATEPLDLQALHDGAREPWNGLPAGTVLGHLHLHVARIPASERFYREVVGFDLTTRFGPTASFLSAGGYHHHLAVNTWAGLDAPRPPEGAAGLRESVLALPSESDVDGVKLRAEAAGVPALRDAHGLSLEDPSGNALRIVAG
jgi:catechol 2,3-dioxygenase